MIRYLQHQQIDLEKWDACIDNALNGLIYPYSFYLNQVSPGWDALIMGDYDAVMPLPVKRRWGLKYLIQPPFVQQLGVFSALPVHENLVKEFLDRIPPKFMYMNMNLNTYNQFQQRSKFTLINHKTFELDLIPGYEILSQNYSSQIRRNISKSKKCKVFVIKDSDPEPIIETFRNNRGKRISHFKEAQYQMLKHLVYSGIHRGNTEIYNAYTASNTFCAGIIFFTSHNKSILIFSGSTPEARTNGAMSAILDQYIKEHAGLNLTLDFEGSDQKNLARFYAGFGSKECVFLQVNYINSPLILKPFIKMYLFAKKRAEKLL
jgi:hypothetical protein